MIYLGILAVVAVSLALMAAASKLLERRDRDLSIVATLMVVASILLPAVLVLYLGAVYPS